MPELQWIYCHQRNVISRFYPEMSPYVPDPNAQHYSLIKEKITQQIKFYQSIQQDYDPRITFNDERQEIYSGYALREFSALFSDCLQSASIDLSDDVNREPGKLNGRLFMPFLHAQEKNKSRNVVHEAHKNLQVPQHIPYIASDPERNEQIATQLSGDKQDLIKTAHQGTSVPFVWVGEQHHEGLGKSLIIEAMPYIKERNGVLMLEHFLYDTQQKLLDKWILGTSKMPMPIELEKYTEALDKEFQTQPPYQFMDILKTAK